MTTAAAGALACAGVIAAAPASAADMLSLGVGGYMEQWVGYANRDDDGADGGFGVQSDSEIHFKGSLESDSGLKFTVHVELEANNEDQMGDNTEIDESYARISGDFGTLEIGQRDPIHARTHYAAAFGAGVGLNAGDTQKWIPGSYLETAGWTIPGDDLGVIYITPRVNGVQVGLSYHPDSTNENAPTRAPENNDDSVIAAGINFNHTVGDMAIKVSLGHVNVSNPGMLKYNMYNNDLTNSAVTAVADDDMMMGFDDKTFTNAGLSVGMGAFTFSASYATRDDGGYMVECWNVASNGDKTLAACGDLPMDLSHTEANEATGTYPGVDADASGAIDGTEVVNAILAVEDKSGQHDTFAVGIGYSDGPMSVSIGHMVRDAEDGTERSATMVSAGYKLAPGVDWKTSIFSVDDTGKMTEGTAFVTGIDLAF